MVTMRNLANFAELKVAIIAFDKCSHWINVHGRDVGITPKMCQTICNINGQCINVPLHQSILGRWTSVNHPRLPFSTTKIFMSIFIVNTVLKHPLVLILKSKTCKPLFWKPQNTSLKGCGEKGKILIGHCFRCLGIVSPRVVF